jgi:alkanesulfonate monooxygenase SsuD/methylene tetrahydromethanopterin reductase-like flavin-dependent oxidoreductase (luciferase family)
VHYGIVLPGGDAVIQLEQAELAERHGWDGVFVWEAAYGVDAWTLLAAMAARTERVKLGTMLTPLPWRRPWKAASQVVTLDQLSGGRAILAVGLGAVDTALGNTAEVTDTKQRAEMMDEGIDLIRGLWERRLAYKGEHYDVDLSGRADLGLVARPVQARIPIWVVGAWPRPRSMRRVLRCDGLIPQVSHGTGVSAGDLREMLAWLRERGGAGPGFDIVSEGETPANDAAAARAQVAPLAEAGATWWLETRWQMPHESPDRMHEVRERIEAGPPR